MYGNMFVNAMLDLLIAAMKEGNIDLPGIQEEVDTFIFAGHETSGMGMAFALLLLAEHKDIQQRAREEIDEFLMKSGGKMDINSIQRFAYHVKLGDYFIPQGETVHLHIYDAHRDPNFWPDPHKFDPDRFLPERMIDRHPFSYIPSSAGLRNCIGQKFAMYELKTFIRYLVHNFYLERIDFASEVTLLMDIVIKPADPIRVRFIPRFV